MHIFHRTPWADARPSQRVIFSERAYAAIVAETHEQHPNETGGILLGHHLAGSWHVIEAIDPGPGSHFSPVTFEYDTGYVNHLARKMAARYERPLRLIGLWHRHPGSNDRFSHDDDITNRRYAEQCPDGAISCLVNLDPHFRITAYHVPPDLRYRRLRLHRGDGSIPPALRELRHSSCLHPDALEDRRQKHLLRALLHLGAGDPPAEPLPPELAALMPELLALLDDQQRYAYGLRVQGPRLIAALVERGGRRQRRLQLELSEGGAVMIQAEDGHQPVPFHAEQLRRWLGGADHD